MMSSQTEYFQIGGYKGDTDAWYYDYDQRPLAGEIYGGLTRMVESSKDMKSPGVAFRDSAVEHKASIEQKVPLDQKTPLDQKAPLNQNGMIELILGIVPNGGSYLLMTVPQMQAVARYSRRNPLRHPRPASAFMSLSPIVFHSLDALSTKIQSYKQKAGKKKKGTEGEDNSPANKAYAMTGGGGGVPRAAFEHQRVLHRILTGEIESGKFGFTDVPWLKSIRILSLVFNSWTADFRTKEEKANDPKYMDIGWTESSPSGLSKTWDAHITVAENILLGNRTLKRRAFEHGETEQLDRASLSERLQEVFEDACGPTSEPIILLVYDERGTRDMLKYHGVDTSSWVTGINVLLQSGRPAEYDRGHRTQRHPYNKLGRRSRSRSPPRRQNYTNSVSPRPRSPTRASSSRYDYDHAYDHKISLPYTSNHDHQPLSDPPKPLSLRYPPVLLVDVKAMHLELMQNATLTVLNLPSTAHKLGLSSDSEGWCAGNECHLLIDMWRSMAQGAAIDEQRAWRLSIRQPEPARPQAIPSIVPAEVSDEEFDPNAVQPTARVAQAYIEDELDSDEDY